MTIPFADSLFNPVGLSTGLFIDKLSGIGGIPKGYITELWGRSGTGKSTVALQMAASFQRQGLRCLWVDSEWSYAPLYADKLGVDNTKMGLYRDTFAENILDTIEDVITTDDGKKKGDWDIIFLDSIGGLLARSEAEKRSGEIVIAAQGKLLAPWLKKVAPKLALHGVSLVVINHAKQDLMSGTWQPSAGEKLIFHKGFSIYLKQDGGFKKGEDRIGDLIVAEVKKNKVAATKGQKYISHFIYGKGISWALDLVRDGMDEEIIVKKGNTLYFGDIKLGVGQHKSSEVLEEDADITERIKHALKGTENT